MRSLLAFVSTVGLLCFSYGCAAEDSEGETTTTPAEHADAPSTTFAAPLPASAPSAEETGVAPTTTDEAIDDGEEANAPSNAEPTAPSATPAAPAPNAAPAPAPAVATPSATPGPKPANGCSVSKDALGFFTRSSGKSDYVAYVPASYSPSKPMRLIVGLHGCSDNALNFAKWGVNPWDTRATQQHIGISVGGESGNNKCWSMGTDDAKVMAAIEDIAKCFWIDRSKIVIGGYSSGGQLAYRVGLKNASTFAGILIENSGLWASGDTPANLLAGASWDIPIAHTANVGDTVFPIAKVRANWTAIEAAGLPLTSREMPGPHNGDGKHWATWLIPQSASWTKP